MMKASECTNKPTGTDHYIYDGLKIQCMSKLSINDVVWLKAVELGITSYGMFNKSDLLGYIDKSEYSTSDPTLTFLYKSQYQNNNIWVYLLTTANIW